MSWDKIRRALGYISVGSGATLIFEKILFVATKRNYKING